MIVLLIGGGFVFASAFDGFVVRTEAKGCCGGGTEATFFSSDNNEESDPCDCLGQGDECSTSTCSDNSVDCEQATECHPNCDDCNSCDAPCRNDDDSEYKCPENCSCLPRED